MIQVRFHGRGGQGAKIASRILGRSGFLSGLQVQDFALFGAERRGAPVVSFTRLGNEPIDQRGYIDEPNLVVVIGDSLLKEAPGQVFHAVEPTTPILVNGDPNALGIITKDLPPADYYCIDLNQIARQTIGRVFVSAAAAGAAAKCIPAIAPPAISEAVKFEIVDSGLTLDLAEKNVTAALEAYRIAPMVNILRSSQALRAGELPWQAVPYLGSSRFAGPTIRHRGSAALRPTGNWRSERPVIDLAKCKRCFLCYLYCPEAAMQLDEENFPHVDFDHCKGCMICYEECPTDAISRRAEL
ncbi:MAG TPA: 2-oxoacid:acceptor oxidoreductase family protein [Candidatus Limnocylindrales bacterium]|nr:2-oxoacid:acceptor oxidoreductase family protein [Candidatus Limnocylindrales bacterium]